METPELSMEEVIKDLKREANNRWKKAKYASDPEYRRERIRQVMFSRSKRKMGEMKPVFRIQTRDENGEMKMVFEHFQFKVKKADLLCDE